MWGYHYLNAPLEQTYDARFRDKVSSIISFIQSYQNTNNYNNDYHVADVPRELIYAETSNYFIKTWYDVVMDYFSYNYSVNIVILRRPLPEVIKSSMELGWYNILKFNWTRYLPHPIYSKNSLIANLESDDLMQSGENQKPNNILNTAYKFNIWHCLDVEKKAQRFVKRYANNPKVKIVQVRLDQLQTQSQVSLFLSKLGLSPTELTWAHVGERSNERTEKKLHRWSKTTISICRERIEQFIRTPSCSDFDTYLA